MSNSKYTREIGSTLLVVGLLLGVGVWFEFSFSTDTRFKAEGRIKANANLKAGQQPENVDSDEVAASVSSKPVVPPQPVSTESPEEAISLVLTKNITDLWISERSGKPYFISQNEGKVEMFEGGTDHQMKVGNGARVGSKITMQFHSTLDNVDGVLELNLAKDGKTLNGHFRGFDPTKEGRVRLLRSSLVEQ